MIQSQQREETDASYKEYLNTIQKKGSKPHHITHCLGARDAWKWIRKNDWELLCGQQCSSSLYGKVISTVNKEIINKLLEGHWIFLPHRMGLLAVAAIPTKVFYKGGKLKDNYRIDWKKTLEYWYEDSEARENKRCIKRINDYLYDVRYSKSSACYKNQKFYNFRANRSLVRTLGKKIENEKINAIISDYG